VRAIASERGRKVRLLDVLADRMGIVVLVAGVVIMVGVMEGMVCVV